MCTDWGLHEFSGPARSLFGLKSLPSSVGRSDRAIVKVREECVCVCVSACFLLYLAWPGNQKDNVWSTSEGKREREERKTFLFSSSAGDMYKEGGKGASNRVV